MYPWRPEEGTEPPRVGVSQLRSSAKAVFAHNCWAISQTRKRSFLFLCLRPFRLHTGGFMWILKLYSLPSWWENQGLGAVWIGVWWRLPPRFPGSIFSLSLYGKGTLIFQSPRGGIQLLKFASHWELGFNVWIWSGAVTGAHIQSTALGVAEFLIKDSPELQDFAKWLICIYCNNAGPSSLFSMIVQNLAMSSCDPSLHWWGNHTWFLYTVGAAPMFSACLSCHNLL